MDAIELSAKLNEFYGSETFTRYSPIYNNITLTEGVVFLAENAGAYWLMDMIGSYLPKLFKSRFGVAKLEVDLVESTATFTLDDGNDTVLVTQKIPYTDFPLSNIKLYVCDNGYMWTILLPQEY